MGCEGRADAKGSGRARGPLKAVPADGLCYLFQTTFSPFSTLCSTPGNHVANRARPAGARGPGGAVARPTAGRPGRPCTCTVLAHSETANGFPLVTGFDDCQIIPELPQPAVRRHRRTSAEGGRRGAAASWRRGEVGTSPPLRPGGPSARSTAKAGACVTHGASATRSCHAPPRPGARVATPILPLLSACLSRQPAPRTHVGAWRSRDSAGQGRGRTG